jgi:hypothetical protein
VGTGSISGGQTAGAWHLPTNPFISPSPSTGRPILLSPCCTYLACSGQLAHNTEVFDGREVGLNFEALSSKISDGYVVARNALNGDSLVGSGTSHVMDF